MWHSFNNPPGAGTDYDISLSTFVLEVTFFLYVDFGHSGQETGAQATPWNTLGEALAVVDVGGIIRINGNSSVVVSSETFTGVSKINQAVRSRR